ncbi:MAG TPA: serine/threonine-protein kinase [Gemmataceae bacterium]|jgi:serine/threonine protein kinase|nr:serine/threonine-protein kinase [Gemmataceae bacterium]
MNDSYALDEQLLQGLPLPLAQLCRRSQNAKTPLERHLTAYYLWESALKLLGATAVVEYAELKDHDPELTEKLKNLARPSVGHWWELVRRLVPVLAEKGDQGFATARELLLGRARDDLPRAAGLDAALLEALDGRSGARATIRLTELFDRLVHYRNREIGHGASGLRSGEFYNRMGQTLLVGLTQVFRQLDVLAGRRLIYVSEVSRLTARGWSIEREALVGETARRIEPLHLPESGAELLPRPERVYLESRQDATETLRPLHPLIHYDPDAREVYFLNSRRGKQQIEYLCYNSGAVLRREVPGAEQQELLGRILSRPVDAASAADWAARSLAEEPADSSAATPAVERTIGEFELLSRLGQGGMGVVYRAWQPSLGRQVALKCMLRGGDPKAEARFAREIRALGRVEHPNVVKVFTSGAEGNQWFYAMELIEGAELSRICEHLAGNRAIEIDQTRWHLALSTACEQTRSQESPLSQSHPESTKAAIPRMPPDGSSGAAPASATRMAVVPGRHSHVETIVEIIRQVAEAVHALHEAGVVHRDIKPGNIMLTADGSHPVLLDLGLAQLADETDKRLTRTRQFVGTLRYASPEQVMAVGQIDGRTDVYSLGATLWELLTLRPIFGADDAMPIPDLMLKIQATDPEGPRKYNPRVPRDLEAIVLKCLKKSPAERYSAAGEFARDLGRWQTGKVVQAERFSGWYKLRKYVKQRRQSLLWAAAVIIALAAGIGITKMVNRDNPETAEDPLVELRRAEVRREVDSIRRRPPAILRAHPAAFEQVDVLPAVDYSAFEILNDERIVDLRQWKQVAPERGSELVCASCMTRRIRLRKLQPVDEIRFEFRTTGTEVFASCSSHPDAYRVAVQKSAGFVGDKRTKVRQLIVDLRNVPLQTEFTIQTNATYWNSLQKADDLWFGAIGYESAFKVSLLIVFPLDKPFKDYQLLVAPTKEQTPRVFEDRKILLVPEKHDWVYWEIPGPKADHVYSLHWSW